MGTATNQIATEKDLYHSGFTNFASSGNLSKCCVTYGDIWDNTESTSSKGINTVKILPTINLTSVNLSAPQGSGQFTAIASYDTSSISMLDSVSFVATAKDAPVSVKVINTGTTTITVNLVLYYGSVLKTAKTLTVASGLTTNVISCLHEALGQLRELFTTSIFKNTTNMAWSVEIRNGSATVTNNYTQALMNLECGSRNQLVKYSDFGGPNNPYYVDWTVKISEGVTSSTAANKIELRYYYSNDSTLPITSSNYKVIGTWTHSGNISGSAEGTIKVNVNPLSVYGSNTTFTHTCLGIWCGSTNRNQTWRCRLKTPSLSSFTNDYELHTNKGKSGLFVIWANGSLVPAWEGVSFGQSTSPVDFLANVKQYNGVEFYIK